MAQFFQLHPDNPQTRLLRQAAQIIRLGGLAALPTDSCYSLVCALDHKNAVERLRRLKGISEKQHLALLCRDLSALGNYAIVSNIQYRLLKAVTPGPYTFILNATKEVPKRISHPSKKSIGLRVPNHLVVQGLLSELDEPLIASTLQLSHMDFPFQEAEVIRDTLEHELDLVWPSVWSSVHNGYRLDYR